MSASPIVSLNECLIPTQNFDANELDLSLMNIATIEANTFSKFKRLKHLRLGNNRLSSLDPAVFSSLVNLTHLFINSNRIVGLDEDLFAHVTRLTSLSVSFNCLSVIRSATFVRLVHLVTLDLSNNQLTSIHPIAFATLVNLKDLYLNDNKLGSLHADTFEKLALLECLYLNGNRLESLDVNLFANCVSLQRLVLYNNRLGELSSDLFCRLPNLKHLRVKDAMTNSINAYKNKVLMLSDEMKRFLDQNKMQAVRRLGTGSFGQVYLIHDLNDSKLKAIKEFKGIRFYSSLELDDIKKEIEIMRCLDCVNIVKYCGSTMETPLLFNLNSLPREFHCILSEYCDNGDLSEKITEKKRKGELFEMQTIFEWSYQILNGLAYLHFEKRIIHKDIKPANIFLHGNRIKLGDFGVSHMKKTMTTGNVSMAGTLCYMSPELFNGSKQSFKSDIWSVGCVICELVYLKTMFYYPLEAQVFKSILFFNENQLKMNNSFMESIVKNMLKHDPADRKNSDQLLQLFKESVFF